jgi:large subunit ribosomal protein L9
MKVILFKDVKGIGLADTVQEVSDGYARNFLLPAKLATPADAASLASLETRRAISNEKKQKEIAAFKELAAQLNGKPVVIKVDSGETGKIFGSVTHADIAKAVHSQLSIDVDKKKIVLDDPIKSLGNFDIVIKLAQDIQAKIKLNVAAASK